MTLLIYLIFANIKLITFLGGDKMAKILISPSKYIQGPGELKKLGQYVENLG